MNTELDQRVLQERLNEAILRKLPLQIIGGGSKSFYGRVPSGKPLYVAEYRGITRYQPEELVLTARSGTTLVEIETALGEYAQMLPFEPPRFAPEATLGGAIACGLSGPRRPYTGAARDFVLGIKVLTGKGEILKFGGEVMKNVAGFDVSRLMVGALGTLGIILEVSLKLLPRPEIEETVSFDYSPSEAIRQMNLWAGQPLPLSAAAFDGEQVHLRLSGSEAGVRAARARAGGDRFASGAGFWHALREHRHPYFQGDAPLWRFSLPAATPPVDVPGQWFIDWGGAQRWLRSNLPTHVIRETARRHGAHATLFRGQHHLRGQHHQDEIFHPLSPALLAVHRRLKAAFDPHRILNPGRLYQEF